jgi:hypothetical protein
MNYLSDEKETSQAGLQDLHISQFLLLSSSQKRKFYTGKPVFTFFNFEIDLCIW